jgi:hypothetical protein
MTAYTNLDFERARHRIAVYVERGEPGKIGLKHLRVAVAALKAAQGQAEGTHWLAPWEVTPAMRGAIAVTRWARRYDADAVYRAARDACLPPGAGDG